MLNTQSSRKILGKLEKNVNYVAYMSDCMVAISETDSTTFGYRRFFLTIYLQVA